MLIGILFSQKLIIYGLNLIYTVEVYIEKIVPKKVWSKLSPWVKKHNRWDQLDLEQLKLDGVWHVTPDTWQVTRDMWQVTFDTWWGVNILSKISGS